MPALSAVGEFAFRKKRDRINWRVLASVDAEKIARAVDINALQEIIDMVTYCDIEAEDVRHLDSNYIKLLQLAQMVIEYLLYCQTLLRGNETKLSSQLAKIHEEMESSKKSMAKHLAQLFEVKKENRSLKKTVYAYQMVSKLPGFGTSVAPGGPPTTAAYHRCKFCGKAFGAHSYLDAHFRRRHPDMFDISYQTAPESEGQQLISRDDSSKKKDVAALEKISAAIEQFSAKIVDTERQIRSEMEQKLEREVQRVHQEAESINRAERLRYEQEIRHMHVEVQHELDKERKKFEEDKNRWENELLKQSQQHKSNVGPLESADESELNITIPKATAVDEILSKLEERQEKTLSTIRDVVRKEIEDMKQNFDLKEQERASKITEDRDQLTNLFRSTTHKLESLQNAIPSPELHRLPTQQSLEPKAYDDSSENESSDNKSNTSDKKLTELPRISDSEDEPTNGDDWDIVSKGLRQHNEISLPQSPWVKSLFAHPPDRIAAIRNQIKTDLEMELIRHGITEQLMHDKKAINQKRRDIERDRRIQHKQDIALVSSYQYVLDYVDKVTTASFKFKPKPMLSVQTSKSAQRRLKSSLKSPSSPTKSPSKVGFSNTPKLASLVTTVRAQSKSPRKSMYDRAQTGEASNFDDEVDWNDDATSFAGSDAKSSDESIDSHTSRSRTSSFRRKSPEKIRTSFGAFGARSNGTGPKSSTPLSSARPRSPRFSTSIDSRRESRSMSPLKKALEKTKTMLGKRPTAKSNDNINHRNFNSSDSDNYSEAGRAISRKESKKVKKKPKDIQEVARSPSKENASNKRDKEREQVKERRRTFSKSPSNNKYTEDRSNENSVDVFDWDVSDSSSVQSGNNGGIAEVSHKESMLNTGNSFDDDVVSSPHKSHAKNSAPQTRRVKIISVGNDDEDGGIQSDIVHRQKQDDFDPNRDAQNNSYINRHSTTNSAVITREQHNRSGLSDIDAVLQDLDLEDL